MSNAFDQIFGNTSAKIAPIPEPIKKEQVATIAPKIVAPKQTKVKSTTQKIDNSNTQVIIPKLQEAIVQDKIELKEELIEPVLTKKEGKKTPVTYGKVKSFFLEPEMLEFFKYVKFKKKIDESQYAIQVFEKAFCDEFGDNWRDMLK